MAVGEGRRLRLLEFLGGQIDRNVRPALAREGRADGTVEFLRAVVIIERDLDGLEFYGREEPCIPYHPAGRFEGVIRGEEVVVPNRADGLAVDPLDLEREGSAERVGAADEAYSPPGYGEDGFDLLVGEKRVVAEKCDHVLDHGPRSRRRSVVDCHTRYAPGGW
jgi:hypothetical protein